MVKRYFKPSVIKTYYPDRRLEGHIFSFGRVGGGKSVSTKSIIESYQENLGYKIFDIYGGEREEGVYWALPSQDKDYFEQELGAIGTLDEDGPKQFRVNILYPYFESKLPKKLPKLKPYVNSTLFTIPLEDVTAEDLKMVMGNISETTIYMWNEIIHKSTKDDNAGSLIHLSEEIKAGNFLLYKNFIIPMSREKFLMHRGCDYNIDIISEAKDKEVITVLCLEFVPKRFHLFIINYILRKIMDHLDLNQIPRDNIIFMREAAEFFRATDDSVVEDRFKIFRTNLSHYIRMGRRGAYFALDCQSPLEVRGLVQGSEDYTLMFLTTAWRDKAEMCEELKREKRMRPDQVADLAFLEKGECYIAEIGKVVKKVKISLPRSAYWKKEYGNFHKNAWSKFGGDWKNISDVKVYINEKFKIIEKFYKEKKKKEKVGEIEEEVIKKESVNTKTKSEETPRKSVIDTLEEFPLSLI